ncbi:MAG: sulfatase [Planctomycetes bacterium]|nr:sulfatase [Planctomycetota bacterium]
MNRRIVNAIALSLSVVVLILVLAFFRGTGHVVALHPTGSVTPPNVILISVDTLRLDHLGCYGYGRDTSPFIDRLASEGVLFENHISSTSWTLPAHAALFTSLSDSVHGCTDADRVLQDKHITLAERFADAGYETAGFFSGPYLHPAFGLGQGFDLYQNCTSYRQVIDARPPSDWVEGDDMARMAQADITSPTVYQAVSSWLAGHGESKFFMFIHLFDVHQDFTPPPPYDTMFDPDYDGSFTGKDFFYNKLVNADMPERDLEHLLALYDGEIAWTDYHIKKIVEELDRRGLLASSIIALTSDHGTEFFEHGWKGHRMTLYDEVVRIPLVIRYPARLAGGVRVAEQTRSIDVGPTLLELAGLRAPEDVMGHSLLAAASGDELAFDNLALTELFSVGRNMRSVRTIQWKFIHDRVNDDGYYFDLIDDPRELRAVRNFSPSIKREISTSFARALATLSAFSARLEATAEGSDIPPEVLAQLKSLGYVGD